MKKILTLLLVLATLFTVAGCSKKENQEEIIGGNTVNPMVSYDSLEEINEIVGTKLMHAPVMGVSDEKFFVINAEIAEYNFTVNGNNYCFRGAKDLASDISGVYIDGKPAFEGSTINYDYASDATNKVCRFLVGDTQYTFAINDNGAMDDDTFVSIANEFYDLLIEDASDKEAVNLIGDYQDSYSQRAKATLDLMGVNNLLIDITWSSSASAYDEWMIYGQYQDGKLVYDNDDIVHFTVDGDEMLMVNDSIGGYFEIVDGNVCWSGSGIEATSSCVFEKIEAK